MANKRREFFSRALRKTFQFARVKETESKQYKLSLRCPYIAHNSETHMSATLDDDTDDVFSAKSIQERYNALVGKVNNKDENRNWNKQFPKKYRIDASSMTQDPEGVKMLDKVATEMIDKRKFLFGTKYREKAVLFRGETFGWDHEDTQNQAYRMLMEKNELGIKLLAEGSSGKALELFESAEALSRKNSNVKLFTARRLKARAVSFNNLGCYFKKVRKFSSALQSLLKALSIEEKVPECGNPAGTHINICVILSEMSRHSQALEHIKSAIVLLEYAEASNTGDEKETNLLTIAHFNHGVELEYLHRDAKALKQYKKAKKRATTILGQDHPLSKSIIQSHSHLSERLKRAKQKQGK